ncbi:class I SAM-dependent methyltransferase [Patescibacteria group bacterium]
MCNVSGVLFTVENIKPEEIRGKRVLEVGSFNVNGSLRKFFQSNHPASYLGIDLVKGPGVDLVCPVEKIVSEFGQESFDLIIATELLEHIRDWRLVINNLKSVCRSGGIILLTTRSIGFPYHGYPKDFWRYQKEDLKTIFADCQILVLKKDPLEPGVFAKIKKPLKFKPKNLSRQPLYSIILKKRTLRLKPEDFQTFRFRLLSLREFIKKRIKKTKVLKKSLEKLVSLVND